MSGVRWKGRGICIDQTLECVTCPPIQGKELRVTLELRRWNR